MTKAMQNLFVKKERKPQRRSTCGREARVEDPQTILSKCLIAMKRATLLRKPMNLLTPARNRAETMVLLARILMGLGSSQAGSTAGMFFDFFPSSFPLFSPLPSCDSPKRTRIVRTHLYVCRVKKQTMTVARGAQLLLTLLLVISADAFLPSVHGNTVLQQRPVMLCCQTSALSTPHSATDTSARTVRLRRGQISAMSARQGGAAPDDNANNRQACTKQDERFSAKSHSDYPRLSRGSFKQRVFDNLPAALAAGLLCSEVFVQNAAAADAKESLRQDYDRFSSKYDELDGGAAAGALGLERARQDMIGAARGLVLEVAVGTGLNLPMYQFRASTKGARGEVDKLIAIDLSPGMLLQAKTKSAGLSLDESQIEFRTMDVEQLDFPDNTFDTVVDTFSLCVFPDPVAALREMKRVCKPDGRILLLENSISDNSFLAAYQVS